MADAELAQRAKSLLDTLCEKPRFAGSAEEARARAICREELEAAGFTCREMPFDYSQWPARWGAPLSAALIAATIVVVTRMANEGRPLLALVIGGAIIATLSFVDAYAKRRWITNFPIQRATSVNLEATRGAPRVWLVAHLDSKSQTVPMLLRIVGSVSLVVVLGLTALALLMALVGLEAVNGLWPAFQIAAVVAAAPGAACFVRNDSAGAVDNASGVVAAILAARSDDAPRDLGVLITSAEELGLAGARKMADTAQTGSLFLNCDTVDDVGGWRCMYTLSRPEQITVAALNVARRIAIPLRVTRLIPGILADNMPFSERGLQAVTISRGTLATLGRIHTRRDFSNTMTGSGAAQASVLLSVLARELT
jgi:hypothetical protein